MLVHGFSAKGYRVLCQGGERETDVTILYAINGDPLEGSVYTAPFEVAEDAVVSAVAVRRGDKAELSVQGTGVAQSRMRVVSRRYYSENGVELTSPEDGLLTPMVVLLHNLPLIVLRLHLEVAFGV